MDYQKSMVSQARERRVLTAVAGDGGLNNINFDNDIGYKPACRLFFLWFKLN